MLVQAAVSLVALAIAHAQAQTQLKESLTRVELAQSIARLGYWERDAVERQAECLRRDLTQFWALPPERTVSLKRAFLDVVLEADRPALFAAYGEANRGDAPGEMQFRVRHARRVDSSRSGVERRAIRDESGRTTHIIGTMQDVTERQRVDLERQRLSDTAVLARGCGSAR